MGVILLAVLLAAAIAISVAVVERADRLIVAERRRERGNQNERPA